MSDRCLIPQIFRHLFCRCKPRREDLIKHLILRTVRNEKCFLLPQILRTVKHILDILNHRIVKVIIAVKGAIAFIVDQLKEISKAYHIHCHNRLKIVVIYIRNPALHLLRTSGIHDTKRQIFVLHVQDHLPDVSLFDLNAEQKLLVAK